jgi:hypothetical protein
MKSAIHVLSLNIWPRDVRREHDTKFCQKLRSRSRQEERNLSLVQSVQNGSGAYSTFSENLGVLPPAGRWLTTQANLLTGLKMRGALPPLHYTSSLREDEVRRKLCFSFLRCNFWATLSLLVYVLTFLHGPQKSPKVAYSAHIFLMIGFLLRYRKYTIAYSTEENFITESRRIWSSGLQCSTVRLKFTDVSEIV